MFGLNQVLAAAKAKCVVQSIAWTGEHSMSDEAEIENAVGMPCERWNGTDGRLLRERIESRYENDGFLAARIVYSVDSTGLLNIELSRGSAYVWGYPENLDSTGTKRDVFARLTGLDIGGYVSPLNLERSRRKLARLGYFEENAPPRMYREQNRNRIIPVYDVRSATMSEVEALLAYSSDDNLWEGSVNVSLFNILGTARDLQIEGFTAEDSRRLEGSYKEPWLFGSNWNVIARGYFDEDSSTREAYGELGVNRDFGFDFTLGAFVGMGENEKTSSLEIAYVSLDRFALPREGSRFEGTLIWNFDRPDTLDHYLKAKASFTHYVPVHGNWIARFGGEIGGTFAPDAKLARNDLFALGGMDDFRGMDYHLVRTRSYGFSEAAILWQDGYDLSIEAFYTPGLYRAQRPEHGWKREQDYGLAFTQYRKNWSFNLYYALRNGEDYLDGILGFGVKTLF